MSFRRWLNQNLLCSHHWHPFMDSYRKIPARNRVCSELPEEEQKYIESGEYGLHYILVKYVKRCCYCDLVVYSHDHEEATIPHSKARALQYRDIVKHPIPIKEYEERIR